MEAIDICSKYAWVVPLKQKSTTISNASQKNEANHKPSNMGTQKQWTLQ